VCIGVGVCLCMGVVLPVAKGERCLRATGLLIIIIIKS